MQVDHFTGDVTGGASYRLVPVFHSTRRFDHFQEKSGEKGVRGYKCVKDDQPVVLFDGIPR